MTIAVWELTDHACRHCMGRLLRSVTPAGSTVCCAECGATVSGECDELCWCGVEVKGYGRVFECVRNPHMSMETPQQILVREKRLARGVEQDAPRRSRQVNIEGY